jgi:F-type H+-transporting ATPase subunit epsilon
MIKLRIVTPEGIFIDNKKCEFITVQAIDGDLGIRSQMAPFVSALKIGTLSFKEEDKDELVYVHLHRGILEVNSEVCKIITERLYLVNEQGSKISTPKKI